MTEKTPGGLFKADLHCHTRHSGHAKHLRFLRCRDCYNTPIDVYRTAKRRGMDLVTITDHDSIGGCLELLDRLGDLPDFIMGEEVTVAFPEFRHEVHVAVYGLNESQHKEIQGSFGTGSLIGGSTPPFAGGRWVAGFRSQTIKNSRPIATTGK